MPAGPGPSKTDGGREEDEDGFAKNKYIYTFVSYFSQRGLHCWFDECWENLVSGIQHSNGDSNGPNKADRSTSSLILSPSLGVWGSAE